MSLHDTAMSRISSQQMTQMAAAMGDIIEASHQIGQIIATIESIAFQTNPASPRAELSLFWMRRSKQALAFQRVTPRGQGRSPS